MERKSFKKEPISSGYSKVLTKTIKSKDISNAAKLIFALLKLNEGEDKIVKDIVTLSHISEALGYSVTNVKKKLEELNCLGYIDIIESSWRSAKIKLTCKPSPEKYERFTAEFLYSKRIYTKDKEFILLISPYINCYEDVIPLTNEQIAEKTGLTVSTVNNHIFSLKRLSYWSDYDGKRHVYLLAIMKDIAKDYIEETYRLKEVIQVKDQIIKHQRTKINELTTKLSKYES